MSPASLRPDPGQVFVSDEHRRVLAHLPVWRSAEDFSAANREAIETGTIADGTTLPTSRSVEEVVDFMVKFDAPQTGHITGDGDAQVAEILADLEADGYALRSGDAWSMTLAGYDALNGPNGTLPGPNGEAPGEPPPLEGKELEMRQMQDELRVEREQELAVAEPQAPNFPLGDSGEAAHSEVAPRREV